MTNREWLSTLSNEDFVNWIYAEKSMDYYYEKQDGSNKFELVVKYISNYSPSLHEITSIYTSSRGALEQWLDEDREEFTKIYNKGDIKNERD